MTDFNDTPEAPAEAPAEVVAEVQAEAVAEEVPAAEAPAEEAAAAVEEVIAEEVKAVKNAKAAKPAADSGKTFKRGDAGVAIKNVQEYLVSKGFTCPSTGIFCVHTHEAVKKYQTSVGAEPTGIVGHEILSLV
jgi:peptidoglycan hydrolase-like protein with peptidoglycan-binding domain